MPRLINRLAPTELKSLKPGRHHDGGGLNFRVSESGARSWELRFMIEGQARYMGLGTFPAVFVGAGSTPGGRLPRAGQIAQQSVGRAS